MSDTVKYREVDINRVLHIVIFNEETYSTMCNPNWTVAGVLFYTIGTYPYMATYCKTCIGKLLKETTRVEE